METDSVPKDTVEHPEEVETKNSGAEINDALADLEEVEISEDSESIDNYEEKTTTDGEEHPVLSLFIPRLRGTMPLFIKLL